MKNLITFLLIVILFAGCKKDENPTGPGFTVSYAGKTYNTVKIGEQMWLKENLDVGTIIHGNKDQANNGVIEKYCFMNNPAYCDTFGGLYQWNEAMQYSTTPGIRGICPPGWHIPTDTEFKALASAIDNNSNALKATGQGIGSGTGTNISGFSAFLAGDRYDNDIFLNFGYNAFFWSSSEFDTATTKFLNLYFYDSLIYLSNNNKYFGYSVRCIKD